MRLLPGNVSISYCVLSIFVLSCNCHLAMAERHCALNAGGNSLLDGFVFQTQRREGDFCKFSLLGRFLLPKRGNVT